MASLQRFVPIVVSLVLLGCASSNPVGQIPNYHADVYPLSETQAGITIGIDEISSPERAERYFGTDLTREGLVPVYVALSNHGRQRVAVKPSDILLYRGRDVVDPLPTPYVVATSKRQHQQLQRTKSDKELAKFFETVAFKDTVLSPNETYRGVIFFAAPPRKGAADRLFSALGVIRDAGSKMRVGVTSVDTGERVRFGPFPLGARDSAGFVSSSAGN